MGGFEDRRECASSPAQWEGSVLTDAEPDVDALPPATPPAVTPLIPSHICNVGMYIQ